VDRLEAIKATASQRVYFHAPQGRPSATPTAGTKDSGSTALTAAATTYVTLMGPDTTLSASAAKGATSITLAAITGLAVAVAAAREQGIPAVFRMTSALDQVEWIEVKGYTAAGVITLASPLQYAYTTDRGSSNYGDFECCGFYYTLQTADVAALAEHNVCHASYVVGGLTYVQRVLYDVCLYPLPNPLTVARVYQRWPDIASQEPKEQRGEDYAPQRADAWHQIRRRIRDLTRGSDDRFEKIKRWRPGLVVDVAELFESGMAQLKVNLHKIGVVVDRDQPTRAELEQEAEAAWQADSRSISWLDVDDDGARAAEGEMLTPVSFVG